MSASSLSLGEGGGRGLSTAKIQSQNTNVNTLEEAKKENFWEVRLQKMGHSIIFVLRREKVLSTRRQTIAYAVKIHYLREDEASPTRR